MRIYLKNNPAKLYSDPIGNYRALGIFKDGDPQQKEHKEEEEQQQDE